jgi:CubicO group peptidase (beta-lactamase class C family)
MSQKFKFICLNFSILLLALLEFQAGLGQKKGKDFGNTNYKDLDELLVRKQKQLGEHLMVLVSNTDTVVYKKTLGEMDDRTATPVAAASKWLTAALVLQMVDEGKISLDDKVSKYLPIYSSYAKNYITIRNCLSHFTGIQAEQFSLHSVLGKKKYPSLEEEVNEFAKHEIQTNPGTEFRYSNIGLDIAARIAEIVGKRKFDMLIRQKLLVPLGMRQTSFSTQDGSAPDPSSGAVSNATDYMHFLQMLLHNGMYNGQRILSEESVIQLRQVQTTPELMKFVPKGAQGYSYALGSWAVDETDKRQATALTSPALFGTFPYVDFCRGYACIIFVKSLLPDQRQEIDQQVIETLNNSFASKCH